MRRSSKFRRIHCTVQRSILIEERKWNDFLAHKFFIGDSLQAEISKLVTRLARHFEKTDGAVQWNSVGPKL